MLTVLIIDDDGAILTLIENLLKRTSYRAVFAHNGPEGLYIARTERPDIILLDDSLPAITSREMMSELRSDARTADIPVIIFSAALESRRPDYARSMGGDGLLAKPFNRADLLSVLDTCLPDR